MDLLMLLGTAIGVGVVVVLSLLVLLSPIALIFSLICMDLYYEHLALKVIEGQTWHVPTLGAVEVVHTDRNTNYVRYTDRRGKEHTAYLKAFVRVAKLGDADAERWAKALVEKPTSP